MSYIIIIIVVHSALVIAHLPAVFARKFYGTTGKDPDCAQPRLETDLYDAACAFMTYPFFYSFTY